MDGIQKTNRETFWITNAEYAKTSQGFLMACAKANVEPTARQASKYRRKQRMAYIRSKTS